MALSKDLVVACKQKLVDTKVRLFNQLLDLKRNVSSREFTGDEGDLSASVANENQLYLENIRIRTQLLEIELALSRIERGTFGICEETNEMIEPQRLLTLPWTRLSIEGAELREGRTLSVRSQMFT